MSGHLFQPISDKTHFPILSARTDQPCGLLMGCDDLAFMAPSDSVAAQTVMKETGHDWHLYGDTRWPSSSVWVEFPLSTEFGGFCGILLLNDLIPEEERDVFEWIANNNPLMQIMPEERGAEVIKKRQQMLRSQHLSPEEVAGPDDATPSEIQSYCIFHFNGEGEPRFIATYTDLLNLDGVPLPKYRMASVRTDDVYICRFALHSLFALNQARMDGMEFIEINQFIEFAPAKIATEQKTPRWMEFHPSRVLRTRPALRACPSPTRVQDGILFIDDAEKIMNIRRRESNAHILAFDRSCRPRSLESFFSDSNASMAAFSHRANGGAIYVLPNRLVEEFNNTDCDEVRVGDITLPFHNVFLRFDPPISLSLSDGAVVDGCYIVKQPDEFLFTLTARFKDMDYEHSLSVACLDPTFSIHLPTQNADLCINDAVERGIEEFLSNNSPPEENLTTTVERPDGTTATLFDVRAESRRRRIGVFRSQEPVFRACLNIIVNAACFIAFRPENISDEWAGEPQPEILEAINDPEITRRGRDRKRNALQRLEQGDFTRIKVCGKNLFSDHSSTDGESHGRSPRAHWRRGHWRRQRHGGGLTLVKLLWIRPTVVMKDSGPLVEARVYEIEKPPT